MACVFVHDAKQKVGYRVSHRAVRHQARNGATAEASRGAGNRGRRKIAIRLAIDTIFLLYIYPAVD